MALKKIMEIEGEAFVGTPEGNISLGRQKAAFTAYCRIASVNANKTIGRITLECKSDNYSMEKYYQVPFSVEDGAPNFIKQAYVYLKTLPEWKNAADC